MGTQRSVTTLKRLHLSGSYPIAPRLVSYLDCLRRGYSDDCDQIGEV